MVPVSFAEFPRAPDRWSGIAPSFGGSFNRAYGNEARPSPEASRVVSPEAGRLHGLFALCTLPSDTFAGIERGCGCGSRVATATPAATAATTVAWKAAEQHRKLTNNGGDSSGPGGHGHALHGPEQGPQDRTARITSHTQAGSRLQEAHQTVTRTTRQRVHVTADAVEFRRLRLVLHVIFLFPWTFDNEKEFRIYTYVYVYYVWERERERERKREYLEKNCSVSEAKFHFAALYLLIDDWLVESGEIVRGSRWLLEKEGEDWECEGWVARGLSFLRWFDVEFGVWIRSL